MRSVLDRLAKGEGMGEAADSRDALCQHGAGGERPSLEALFHAAMLEEELRMQVEDMFADIKENQLNRFHHIGADRSEWQALHIRAFDFGQATLRRYELHLHVFRIRRIERWQSRMCALMQDER